MLQTTRQDTQSPTPGGKVTETESEDGRRRHPERARTKSVGTGDVMKWRSGRRRETEGT